MHSVELQRCNSAFGGVADVRCKLARGYRQIAISWRNVARYRGTCAALRVFALRRMRLAALEWRACEKNFQAGRTTRPGESAVTTS